MNSVKFARFCTARAGQRGRPGSTKLEGLRLEQAIERILPDFQRGRWAVYLDEEGRHYCQFDFLAFVEGVTVIVECKRTWHSYVLGQLRTYVAVARRLFVGPVVAAIVVGDAGKLTRAGLDDAVRRAVAAGIDITYWTA